jgi:hypothetical protein
MSERLGNFGLGANDLPPALRGDPKRFIGDEKIGAALVGWAEEGADGVDSVPASFLRIDGRFLLLAICATIVRLALPVAPPPASFSGQTAVRFTIEESVGATSEPHEVSVDGGVFVPFQGEDDEDGGDED